MCDLYATCKRTVVLVFGRVCEAFEEGDVAMYRRRFLGYVLLLSLVFSVYAISAVYALCILPTCRQSEQLANLKVGDTWTCSRYNPWYINTGGWWALANEGNWVAGQREVTATECYYWDELCPGQSQSQEVTNCRNGWYNCENPISFQADVLRCTNGPPPPQ